MNIIFFGTSTFAAHILDSLLKNNFTVKAVVTRVDKPQGRNQQLLPPPIKAFIQKSGIQIPVLQPKKASTEEFEKILKSYSPDIFVVIAYGEIIKKNILDIPPLGCVNIHPSLLPKHRGPAPIHYALLEGDAETGVSIIEMSETMDAGDILAQKKLKIDEEDNFESLENKLLTLSQELIIKVLLSKQVGNIDREVQDHSLATFTQKLSTEKEKIDWSNPATVNFNLIRALSPKPGAWCNIQIGEDIRRIKILKTKLLPEVFSKPGEIIQKSKNSLIVSCSTGSLSILEVQPEGKKKLSIVDFLNGMQNSFEFVS